jgi:hypothetical protein
MSPLGAFILLVLVGVVFGSSRRGALLGMLAGVMFLTEGLQIQIVGFNLYAIRFLELAGFVRVLSRHEFSFARLNRIDRALLWLYGFMVVVFLLRSEDGQAYQIGAAMDAFLCYFTFRGLISEMDDLRWLLRALVILLIPYVLLVIFESMTGHNLFKLVGGMEGGAHWMRHGWPRCFGSFRQPDTLGMFAGSFLPLYIGLACIARERKRAVLGIGLCLILVVAANSGGAASAAAMGLLGWGFWRIRTQMRKVRWTIMVLLALLALVMKAPIWYIFARASAITGGDGWHRSYLIDVTYRHLGEWWLAGMPLTATADWFPYTLEATGGADISNQYIAFALTAVVGAVVIFILLLKRGFSALGQAMNLFRNQTGVAPEKEFLFWGMGVALAVHIINWFGISYFDQMYVVWLMQLAVISGITQKVLVAELIESRPPDETTDRSERAEAAHAFPS